MKPEYSDCTDSFIRNRYSIQRVINPVLPVVILSSIVKRISSDSESEVFSGLSDNETIDLYLYSGGISEEKADLPAIRSCSRAVAMVMVGLVVS